MTLTQKLECDGFVTAVVNGVPATRAFLHFLIKLKEEDDVTTKQLESHYIDYLLTTLLEIVCNFVVMAVSSYVTFSREQTEGMEEA